VGTIPVTYLNPINMVFNTELLHLRFEFICPDPVILFRSHFGDNKIAVYLLIKRPSSELTYLDKYPSSNHLYIPTIIQPTGFQSSRHGCQLLDAIVRMQDIFLT
jgi:hypothetical protein